MKTPRVQMQPEHAVGSSPCVPGMHILVVDDEAHNLRLLSQTLKRCGYEVQTANHGEQALQAVAARLPDLILLDIMMPKMDGYEVCRRLKADGDTRDIPIIFISALDEIEYKVNALEMGGVDYITKPIQIQEVLARVRTHLMIYNLQKQLEDKNAQLEREVLQHQETEAELGEYRDHLEDLVAARVAELEYQIARRKELEDQLQTYTQHLEDLVAENVKELELERAKVLQTAKLAALGEMATGVAHELNQPLTAILFDADYLKTLVERVKAGGQTFDLDELYEIGVNLADDVTRAQRITDHLRAFGRISQGDIVPVDVHVPLKDSTILVQERFRLHNIELHWDLQPDLPLISANPNKLEQVFMNLINNAEYALEEMARRVVAGEVQRPDYHKCLRISTRYAPGDGASGRNGGDSIQGWVLVKICDNGCGISTEHQARLFEPFFTTKAVGESVGLGLSISYGIVREFGGDITCESVENEGTTFTMRFPIMENR